VVLDAETVPSVDVTAARMLDQLARDLQQQGVQLIVARDVGQVRDVLRRANGTRSLVRAYPTVQDAVQALRRAPPEPYS
jgi:sulfate permease, SulP family